MKSISCWEELAPFGIVALTGEACGLSYRILCDVTHKGKELLEKVFGLNAVVLHPNWNRGCEADPHVGCVMLVPELLTPLAVFALLEHGCKEVWSLRGGATIGVEGADSADTLEQFRVIHADKLARRFGYFGTAGERNVHVMTGRVY